VKLAYELATVSYCPDLTDSNAAAVPIAVLIIGRLQEHERARGWVACAASIDAKRLGVDPLAGAMLADVPHLIRRHVDRTMAGLRCATDVRRVLVAFHESLKTSIHVSEIADPVELEVADGKTAADRVLSAALEGLIKRIEKRTKEGPGQHGWRPRVSPEELVQPLPEHIFWQPVSAAPAA
jgi:hypothetical protein